MIFCDYFSRLTILVFAYIPLHPLLDMLIIYFFTRMMTIIAFSLQKIKILVKLMVISEFILTRLCKFIIKTSRETQILYRFSIRIFPVIKFATILHRIIDLNILYISKSYLILLIAARSLCFCVSLFVKNINLRWRISNLELERFNRIGFNVNSSFYVQEFYLRFVKSLVIAILLLISLSILIFKGIWSLILLVPFAVFIDFNDFFHIIFLLVYLRFLWSISHRSNCHFLD